MTEIGYNLPVNREPLTVGVEEEFLLVDADGRLSLIGPELVRAASTGDGADPDGSTIDGEVQRELARCQVEAVTGICTSAAEIRDQVRELRSRLADRAAERGVRVVPSGAPVLSEDVYPDITPDPRYRRMVQHFGAVTNTAGTCGCHVHVAVPDRATGVAVSDQLRPWLPMLLALTANSPYHYGVDTAYSSWRNLLWSRWPSSGPPPLFRSLDRYEASVDALLRSQAALDRGMIYWDIRISERHPTLEFRVSDVAATADEAALLAALIRGMVATALDSVAAGRPPVELPTEVLRANLWRAARDGLGGHCLHPESGQLLPVAQLVRELVSSLEPVLRSHGDLELVQEVLAWLDQHGGAAARQRAVYARRSQLADVIDSLAVVR